MSAAVSRAEDDLVDLVRQQVRELVTSTERFPADPRLESAAMHLVGALSDLTKFQMGIGGGK